MSLVVLFFFVYFATPLLSQLYWADEQYTAVNLLFESSGWTNNECPTGYVVAGFYHTDHAVCSTMSCLEYLICVTPTYPPPDQSCKDYDVYSTFDDPGAGNFLEIKCDPGYFIRGFWYTYDGCDGIHCIETLRCCQYDTSKITYSSSDVTVDWWYCFDGGSGECVVSSNQYLTGLYRAGGKDDDYTYIEEGRARYLYAAPTPYPTPYPTPKPSPNPTPSPSEAPTKSPTEYPTVSPTRDCEAEGKIKHVNWYQLQHGEEEKPDSNLIVEFESDKLQIAFDIELEYVGSSSDGMHDHDNNLGTTYVIDFQSFSSNKDAIYKPGNCQNRLINSFDLENSNFSDFWSYSEQPGNVGLSTNYLAYPEPSAYWDLSMNGCGNISYYGQFSWSDLTTCTDFEENKLIEIVDTATNIILYGTLYVNLVSPYVGDSDIGFYRTHPLIQQDFQIDIIKQLNVLSSTNTILFITSIISIFEDETDGSFEMTILTQSADYLMLTNPIIAATPFGTDNITITDITNNSCLIVGVSYTCSQLFTISIPKDYTLCDSVSVSGSADFSGVYSIVFIANCREGNEDTVCQTFLSDNGPTLALEVESNFIDHSCEPKIYSILFNSTLTFYDDEEFMIQHTNESEDYVIGLDRIYVDIIVNFPDTDNETRQTFEIFHIQIENVFVCTANDSVDLITGLDQLHGRGGCLSNNVDSNGVYDVILNGVENINYYTEIISLTQEEQTNNLVRFSFLTFDVPRSKIYVHAEILIILQNDENEIRRIRRRAILGSNNEHDTDQIRHCINKCGVQH